jgi:hypothetical protein
MGKSKPPGTTTHTIYLPDAIHTQVASVAGYGGADDLIIECIREAMKPRWAKWLREETEKLRYDADDENGKKPVRRSSPPDAENPSAKDSRNKKR